MSQGFHNVGSDIIEAYLKGVAVKNQREENISRAQQHAEAMKLRDQQLKQNLQIANDRAAETTRWHDLQNEKAKADRKVKIFEAITKKSRSLQLGFEELIDPQAGFVTDDGELNVANFRETPKGTAIRLEAEKAGLIERAKTDPLVNRAYQMLPVEVTKAREKALAELPARTNLAMIQSELQAKNQKAQRDWQTIENQKMRDAALSRANLVLEGRLNATREEKNNIVQQTVDSHEPEVLTGRMTFEDMNKVMSANTRAATQNELRKRDIIPLHDQQREDLKLLPMAQSFYGRLKELNAIINTHSDPRAAELDPKYEAKMKEVQQDLDAWGRAVKGFKGMITERDTERLIGGIPKSFPSGPKSLLDSKKSIKEINQERVDKIEDFIQEKFDLITRGSSSKQTSAVREQYGINPLSERQFRARYKKAK